MRKITILLFFSIICIESWSQESQIYVPETDPLVLSKLGQWQDLKFGLLMHWGPYSQWGIVESWSICPEDYGWCERKKGNHPESYAEYKREYENLKTTFNPVLFDPDRWANAAADAGMRYLIFTTKHHDGFCMFDTKLTDYKVTDADCPFHAHPRPDITREIFDAFRKQGMWVGPYFSKPDWHCLYYWDPYFPPLDRNVNYDPQEYPEKWEKFIRFTHDQVLELMTGYGPIDILWLDGGWVAKQPAEEIARYYADHASTGGSGFLKSSVVNQDIRMDELVGKAREKQPGLIVVDRAVCGKNQNYLTPENQVPEEALSFPWESCIISGGGWSWVPDAHYMSGHKAVQLLVDIVAKGGNLLLNIAPGPDGAWDEGAYRLLEEIGGWMKVNGEAIYDTRAIEPYKEGKVCLTSKKDGTLYLIYLADEDEKEMPSTVSLSELCPDKDARITLMGSNQKLNWKRQSDGFSISIPKSIQINPPCRYAWVIKVDKVKNTNFINH
ncbi:MAG TPA: alpha-L-fucosidase [Bacteroidales bacterium]|nr:alpha-L-fucosidase [Bacteroidales bacterium]